MTEGENWAREQMKSQATAQEKARIRQVQEYLQSNERQFLNVINAVEVASKMGSSEFTSEMTGFLSEYVIARCLKDRHLVVHFSGSRRVYKFWFKLPKKQ